MVKPCGHFSKKVHDIMTSCMIFAPQYSMFDVSFESFDVADVVALGFGFLCCPPLPTFPCLAQVWRRWWGPYGRRDSKDDGTTASWHVSQRIVDPWAVCKQSFWLMINSQMINNNVVQSLWSLLIDERCWAVAVKSGESLSHEAAGIPSEANGQKQRWPHCS